MHFDAPYVSFIHSTHMAPQSLYITLGFSSLSFDLKMHLSVIQATLEQVVVSIG